MDNIIDGIVCVLLIAPAIVVVFCFTPRFLVLREIGEILHIKNPKVKWTSFGAWVMLSYYCHKVKNKGGHLKTYIIYICSLILACITAILVVISAFGNLQRYEIIQQIADKSFLSLCLVNIICFLQLRFKYRD